MPYSHIVLTCGVSTFAKANAPRKWTESKGLLTFPSDSMNPAPSESMSEAMVLQKLKRAISYPKELDDLCGDPTKVSAEFSALHALKKERRLADKPTVVLIHTETFGGRAAVCILKEVMESHFCASVETVGCSFNVDDRKQLLYDLGAFMGKVATALRGRDTNTTCFFPLGGYKVMVSLGTLAAGYFGFPTLYLHEDKQIFHEIPAAPWGIADDKLREIAPSMKRLPLNNEESDLTPEGKAVVQQYPWLFEVAGGRVNLNAFGHFIIQQNPRLCGTKVLVSKKVDLDYRDDNRKQFVLQQLGVLSQKLAQRALDPDLEHEKDWKVSSNDDWHLYKGASNGQLVMRAIYRYERDEDTLTVKYVWTSHDYIEDFEAKWMRPLEETVEWSLS